MYISDLRTNLYYNKKAKRYLDKINLKNYSTHEVRDAIEYIYSIDLDDID